jgi:hypothetical protein
MSRDELLKKVRHLVHLAPNRTADASAEASAHPLDRHDAPDLFPTDEAAALQALLDNWE